MKPGLITPLAFRPKTALPGGGRAVTGFHRGMRKKAAEVRRWVKASDCAAWVSERKLIRSGPICGGALENLTSTEPVTSALPPKKRHKRREVHPLKVSAPVKRSPVFARPKDLATNPAVPGQYLQIPEVPKACGAGRLRALAGDDPPQPAARDTQTKVVHFALPAPDKKHQNGPPSAQDVASWYEELAERVSEKLSPPDNKAPACRPEAIWARLLTGKAAPYRMLKAATRSDQALRSPMYDARPEDKRQHRAIDILNSRSEVDSKSDASGEVSNRQAPTEPQFIRHKTPANETQFADAETRETLAPPPHASPPPSPPQPDILRPSEATHTPTSTTQFGLPGFAHATDAAPSANTPAKRGFNQDDLSDALARILRDEARRHGIDI